jgi:hypothetical protein
MRRVRTAKNETAPAGRSVLVLDLSARNGNNFIEKAMRMTGLDILFATYRMIMPGPDTGRLSS